MLGAAKKLVALSACGRTLGIYCNYIFRVLWHMHHMNRMKRMTIVSVIPLQHPTWVWQVQVWAPAPIADSSQKQQWSCCRLTKLEECWKSQCFRRSPMPTYIFVRWSLGKQIRWSNKTQRKSHTVKCKAPQRISNILATHAKHNKTRKPKFFLHVSAVTAFLSGWVIQCYSFLLTSLSIIREYIIIYHSISLFHELNRFK